MKKVSKAICLILYIITVSASFSMASPAEKSSESSMVAMGQHQ